VSFPDNVTIGDEFGLTDTSNCLSVTTTMEAGVDIAVRSRRDDGNMPPMRFNYQSARGTSGRSGAAFRSRSLCEEGRSPEDYSFQRPRPHH